MPNRETGIITLKKRKVCPECGMTIEKGAQMYRSLTKPNTHICTTCALSALNPENPQAAPTTLYSQHRKNETTKHQQLKKPLSSAL